MVILELAGLGLQMVGYPGSGGFAEGLIDYYSNVPELEDSSGAGR